MRRRRLRIVPQPPIIPGAIYLNDASGLAGTSFPAGSIILIKRGSTAAGPLTFSSSGTASAPIFIGAYGIGAKPILTGDTPTYTDCLTITGSHVRVSGLAFANTNRSGVQVPNYSSTDVIIFDCEMSHCGQGVGLNGTYCKMLYCYVHDLDHLVVNQGTSGDYGANGVVIGNGNCEVGFNYFIRCIGRTPIPEQGDTTEGASRYLRQTQFPIYPFTTIGGRTVKASQRLAVPSTIRTT